MIHRPGNHTMWGKFRIKPLAPLMIAPHSGAGAGTPSPRKLMEAFWRIMEEIFPDEPVKQRENVELVNSRAAIYGINEYPEVSMLVRKIFDEYRNKGAGYREMVKYLLRVFMLELVRINGAEGKSHREAKGNRHFEQIIPALRFVDANYARELKETRFGRR